MWTEIPHFQNFSPNSSSRLRTAAGLASSSFASVAEMGTSVGFPHNEIVSPPRIPYTFVRSFRGSSV